MKRFFGYTRVSTAKQGEHGVSLQEQKSAITAYALRYDLAIIEWFEERETAAKRGRPLFSEMMRALESGKAEGVIIHKIDRSARNLKDWADLGELIDRGIEVHFANESLDLHSRGGRLSADIQAVVAADYVRNLREETRKGFYGRLKQGVYPLGAPIGYLNRGKGKLKAVDPVKGPLVKKLFQFYGSGRFTLHTLRDEMARHGLTNHHGKPLSINGLSVILNNPFYIGLIRLRSTGETFPGAHEPLIGKSLFDRVHAVLTGKVAQRNFTHDFLFRRLLTCERCSYSLIGERQKGHQYYRCHTRGCPVTSVREEAVDAVFLAVFSQLELTDFERWYLFQCIKDLKTDWSTEQETQKKNLELHHHQLRTRLNRLTDAFIDGVLEKRLFEERKTSLLLEEKSLEERRANLTAVTADIPARVAKFLELAGSAYVSYKTGVAEEKRDLIKITTSNRVVEGKNVRLELKTPFQIIANRQKPPSSALQRDRPRTYLDAVLKKVWHYFSTERGP